MLLLSLLASLLLPVLTLSARAKPSVSGTSSTFTKYQARSVTSSHLILDDRYYADLITKPRDYGFVVCLTAMASQFGCKVCQDFDPEWRTLASSWSKADRKGEKKMLFGTIDFVDGKSTFQSVCNILYLP